MGATEHMYGSRMQPRLHFLSTSLKQNTHILYIKVDKSYYCTWFSSFNFLNSQSTSPYTNTFFMLPSMLHVCYILKQYQSLLSVLLSTMAYFKKTEHLIELNFWKNSNLQYLKLQIQ